MCGKRFFTEPIEKLYPDEDESLFGLCIIHGEQSLIYTFTRSDYNLIKRYDVQLPNRHNRGGQSQNRHQRNNDIIVNVYIDNVVQHIKEAFLGDYGVPIIEGIIFVGTGEKRFKVESKLPPILQKLVYRNDTITSTTTNIEEILEKYAKSFIEEITLRKEVDIFNEFLGYLESQSDSISDRAVYGIKEVTKSFKDAQLQKLIIVKSKNSTKIKETSKSVGCEIKEISKNNIIGSRLLKEFGGVVGIRWF